MQNQPTAPSSSRDSLQRNAFTAPEFELDLQMSSSPDIDPPSTSQFHPSFLSIPPDRRVFKPPPCSQLHSSFIPTQEDELRIKTTISEIDSTLVGVDDEILRLKTVLADLEGYRSSLQNNIQEHQAVISPIRHLPHEILAEIFTFAAEGHFPKWPFDADGHDSIPWVLGKVCSYWRVVALSLPKLWSEIHLDLDSVAEPRPGEPKMDTILARRSNRVQELLQACLVRSGNEMLVFSVASSKSLATKETLKPVLTLLVQQAERWADAAFNLDYLLYFHIDLSPAKNRVHNLRRLQIGTYQQDDDIYLRPLEAFEFAPKLRELKMMNVLHPFYTLRVPWSQITSLVSKSTIFREGEFTDIMRHAVNLGSFTTEGERIIEVASSQPVLLSHLSDLTIISKGSYIPKTFQFLTMPNLQKLTVHALTPFLADQTIPMLIRSECKPVQLTFSSSLDENAVWEENIGIVRFLGELPSLTSLHLIVMRSANEIMPRLHCRHQLAPPSMLPNLQTIKLEDRLCLSATMMVEALSSRIENYDTARWGPWPKDRTSLKSITLSLSRPPAPVYPELDALEDAASKLGVEIKVVTR